MLPDVVISAVTVCQETKSCGQNDVFMSPAQHTQAEYLTLEKRFHYLSLDVIWRWSHMLSYDLISMFVAPSDFSSDLTDGPPSPDTRSWATDVASAVITYLYQ